MQTPASRPASRQQLKDFCLRQLGAPVLDINVDDDQVEDCIDLALQYFQDFHFDGVERWYLKHQISADDKTNQWIPITENILGVNKVWNVSSTNASVNMFDLRYQMRLHELYDFTSTSYVNYVMTMQHIRTLDMLFSGEIPVRFNRHTDKLYIDWDWENDIEVGEYIIVEGWIIIDPRFVYRCLQRPSFEKPDNSIYQKAMGHEYEKVFWVFRCPVVCLVYRSRDRNIMMKQWPRSKNLNRR